MRDRRSDTVGSRRRRQHGERIATRCAVGAEPRPGAVGHALTLTDLARPVRENGTVSLYRDDGIVLRTQKLGEADRIVTVLTRRTGRVRAVGKGVRRTKSRFGARLEPFTHVDLLLYTGRSLDVITQAETVRAYGEPLATDYPRYTSGTAMLETAERFTPVEKEPSLRQFLLLVGGLRALGEGTHDPRLVLDAYLLRSLAVAGYAPALDECAICGTRAAVAGGQDT